MIKKSKVQKLVVWLATVIFLVITQISVAVAADVREITVEADAASFTIDLIVEVSEAYAGIEFGLTLSDESAVKFVSFEPGNAIKGSSVSPFTTVGDIHYFGFYQGSNRFSGKLTVGTLHFTYTGNRVQTVELTYMQVARIVDGELPVGEKKDSPVTVYSVRRQAESGDATDNNADDSSTTDHNTGNSGTAGKNGGNSGAPAKKIDSNGASENTNNSLTHENINGTDDMSISVHPAESIRHEIKENDIPLSAASKTKSTYFDDVNESWAWAINEIDSIYEAGITMGTEPKMYAPAANITRGDFILMLMRTYELMEHDFDDNFSDVQPGSYYFEAVGIAKKLGIAEGTGDNNFTPYASITRQDLMVLVERTLRIIGKPLPDGSDADLASFSDQDIIAPYARAAIAKMVKSGIISGDAGQIHPLSNATRAEMAVILFRLLTIEQKA